MTGPTHDDDTERFLTAKPRKKPRKAREWLVHYSHLHGFEECNSYAQDDLNLCLACNDKNTAKRIRVREVLPKRRKP